MEMRSLVKGYPGEDAKAVAEKIRSSSRYHSSVSDIGMFLLLEASLQQNDFNAAVFVLEQFPAGHFADEALIRILLARFTSGNYDRAAELVMVKADAIGCRADLEKLTWYLAEHLRKAGRIDDALVLYDRVQSCYPEGEFGSAAGYRIGWCLANRKVAFKGVAGGSQTE